MDHVNVFSLDADIRCSRQSQEALASLPLSATCGLPLAIADFPTG